MLTRRHVIAAGALLAVGSVTGGGGLGYRWWHQDAGNGLRVLSDDEVEFLDAFAEAIFPAGGEPPLGGREAAVSGYFDGVLAALEPLQSDLLRAAIHALDNLPLVTHGAWLRDMPPAEAAEVIRMWMAHPRGELRGVVQSLHFFVGMAYLSHPDVSPRLIPFFGCGFGR